MVTLEEILKQNSPLSLTDRREFLKLPLEERRKIIETQAERMRQHYEQECEFVGRETWQGEDIVEL
jgi:hypothetical protein